MELWSTYISIFQIKYHEVKYENLVKNLETTSKQLLKFLELPWNDNVLKFFETAKEKNKGGFGLGLAIAKKIIEAHNGKLNIQSVIGKGSNFTLLIPKENNEKRK